MPGIRGSRLGRSSSTAWSTEHRPSRPARRLARCGRRRCLARYADRRFAAARLVDGVLGRQLHRRRLERWPPRRPRSRSPRTSRPARRTSSRCSTCSSTSTTTSGSSAGSSNRISRRRRRGHHQRPGVPTAVHAPRHRPRAPPPVLPRAMSPRDSGERAARRSGRWAVHSLLAPRALQKGLERLRRAEHRRVDRCRRVERWADVTKTMTSALDADAAASRWLSARGHLLPGLSYWAVCRPSVHERTAPAVTVIVPCYNEAARLDLDRFEELLDRPNLALLFVDDGSTDGTAALIADWSASTSGPSCCACPGTSARAKPSAPA